MKEVQLRNRLKRKLGHFYFVLGLLIFVSGVTLRLVAADMHGSLARGLADFGTFIAVAVTVPFIYERFIKSDDKAMFLDDLRQTIDHISPKAPDITVFPGRPSIQEEADFLSTAKREVIQVGITMTTLSLNLENRPARDFRDHIERLLQAGVRYRCLSMDPQHDLIREYGQDQKEHSLAEDTKKAIERLERISEEITAKGYPGSLEIYVHAHFPCFRGIFIDGNEIDGQMLMSPCMFRTRRAETPTFRFSRLAHRDLFDRYWASVNDLILNARRLP